MFSRTKPYLAFALVVGEELCGKDEPSTLVVD